MRTFGQYQGEPCELIHFHVETRYSANGGFTLTTWVVAILNSIQNSGVMVTDDLDKFKNVYRIKIEESL